jgi:ribosome-associated translation inhibitor RaiA
MTLRERALSARSRRLHDQGGSLMEVLVNTDSSVQGHEALATDVERAVRHALERFSDRITRVEVHLSDENSHKHGATDKRCLMEARIAGRQPTAVTHHAEDLTKAVAGASDKLKRALDTVFGKLATH